MVWCGVTEDETRYAIEKLTSEQYRCRIVLTLRVPRLAELGPASIAELRITYVTVGDEIAEHLLTVPVAVNLVSADEAATAEADLEVREEVEILKAAQARDEAIRLADNEDWQAAQALIAESRASMLEAGTPALAAEADELEQVLPHINRAQWQGTRKDLRYASNFRRRHRGHSHQDRPDEPADETETNDEDGS